MKRSDLYTSPLWNSWRAMKERCLNPNNISYPRYGGRGIQLCAEWRSFSKFRRWALANGHRDGLTIERIDNDGPYSPENCRWATWDEQQNHRRNNHLLTVGGDTKTVAQWSRATGIPYRTLLSRIVTGWVPEAAVSTPVGAVKTGPKPRRAS